MTDTAAAVEHTPGPWEMLIPSEDVPDSGIIQTVEGRVLVAVAALSGFSFEERAANARLIAAAPAMLAALEAVHLWMLEHDDVGGDGCPFCGIHANEPEACDIDETNVCAQIRAAIAQARGGEAQ